MLLDFCVWIILRCTDPLTSNFPSILNPQSRYLEGSVILVWDSVHVSQSFWDNVMVSSSGTLRSLNIRALRCPGPKRRKPTTQWRRRRTGTPSTWLRKTKTYVRYFIYKIKPRFHFLSQLIPIRIMTTYFL